MALDIDKFIVIVLNLLSNAIKFTPTGGEITICVLNEDSSLKIIVKDNGIGIPPHRLKDILSRFVQIDNIMRRQNDSRTSSKVVDSIEKSFVDLLDIEFSDIYDVNI